LTKPPNSAFKLGQVEVTLSCGLLWRESENDPAKVGWYPELEKQQFCSEGEGVRIRVP